MSDTNDVPSAVKSVIQRYTPNARIVELLETFRQMVNDSIRIGLTNDVHTLKKLSLLSYGELARYGCPSYYKYTAISRATGILAARMKSIRRGYRTKSPDAVKPQLVAYFGFKLKNGVLKLPIGEGQYFEISLDNHSMDVLAANAPVMLRSITLTANTVSLTISKKVPQIECTSTAGLDRNLRELTYGNGARAIHYNLSKAVKIAVTTTEIASSFNRNDARIRKKIGSKYGKRRKDRIGHMLHCVTKDNSGESLREQGSGSSGGH